MRLLIDECLPRALKRLLRGHTCRTVQEMAWSGIKNGALLSLAQGEFDALITIDPRLRVSAKPQGAQNRYSPAGLKIESDRGLSANRARCSYRARDDPAGSGCANRRVVIFRVSQGRGQANSHIQLHLVCGAWREIEKRAREMDWALTV